MKKTVSWPRFLAIRLLTFAEIGLKFCLFLPILLFMVWFNYKVDVSGLFQGELAPRQVANLLLEGSTVSGYDQMDERQVLEVYVQNLTEAPDTLALGSSRVLQLSEDLVGGGSFFNAGISGAGPMDIMNIWYLFEREDKLPGTLILEVDPWLFNADPDINRNSDSELFAEFLEKSLGINADYEEPDTVALWKALVDPAYFQGNVTYYLKQRQTGAVLTEDGDDIPFKAVTGSIDALDYAVKRADGSIQYPLNFRSWNYDQVMAEVLAQAGTLNALHGFDQMDPYWTDLFTRFIEHVQAKGVNVVFLMTPYHPFIVLHVYNNPEGFTGFFEVEPWVREYAAMNGIPVYGSYHAGRVGIQESMFFDGLHCKPEALQLMFPGVQAALADEQTAYETLYLEEYGDVENSASALIGYDAACVVVDQDWECESFFAGAARPGFFEN